MNYLSPVRLRGVLGLRLLLSCLGACSVVLVSAIPAGAAAEPHEVGAATVAAASRHSGLGISESSVEAYFAQLLPTISWIPGRSTRDGPEVVGQAIPQQCAVVLDGPSSDLDEMAFFCRAQPKDTLQGQDLHYLTTVAQKFTSTKAEQWFAQQVTAATAALSHTRGAGRVARYTTAGTRIKMSGVMMAGTRRQATIAITSKGVQPLPQQT